MKFYVVATDRTGSEMRPGGIVLSKHVINCDTRQQAEKVCKMLKERARRFSAIQLTTTPPVLKEAIYGKPILSEASVWLQGR